MHGFILYFDWLKLHHPRKTEDSMKFKTGQRVLCKQGWTFRDLNNFHIIFTHKKKVTSMAKINQILYMFGQI